jgi:hypothetical protein
MPAKKQAADCGGNGADVCYNETKLWRRCLENIFERGKATKEQQPMDVSCVAERTAFDDCVAKWRAVVGPDVKLRGPVAYEPPVQCAPMACLYESCMANSRYETRHCTGAMQQFKHCVKALHGSEYVLD